MGKELEAKRFLRKCRDDMKSLDILREARESLYLSLFPAAIRSHDAVVQTSSAGDRMAESVSEIAALDAEIQEQIRSLAMEQARAYHICRKLSRSAYRSIIISYYLSQKVVEEREVGKNRKTVLQHRNRTWDDVAGDLNYGRRQLTNLHGAALLEFDRIMKGRYEENADAVFYKI